MPECWVFRVRTTRAQQTHCGSPQLTVDNSIELSHLLRLEFRGYLRHELEGRYRQNGHHCLANATQKREPADLVAFLEVLRVRCCCFQCRTGTYVPRDTGGRCDTFIFITLHKILIDTILYVLLSQSFQVTRNGNTNARYIFKTTTARISTESADG